LGISDSDPYPGNGRGKTDEVRDYRMAFRDV